MAQTGAETASRRLSPRFREVLRIRHGCDQTGVFFTKKLLFSAAAILAAASLSFPAYALAGWKNEPSGWSYTTESGTQAKSGWLQIDGKWYYFDDDGWMAHDCWIDGMYYVGSDGALLTDTVTPDGVRVAADGTPTRDADASKTGVYYEVDGTEQNKTTVIRDSGNGVLDVRFASLNTRVSVRNSAAAPDTYTGTAGGRTFSLRFTGSTLYITMSDNSGVYAVRNEKYIYSAD